MSHSSDCRVHTSPSCLYTHVCQGVVDAKGELWWGKREIPCIVAQVWLSPCLLKEEGGLCGGGISQSWSHVSGKFQNVTPGGQRRTFYYYFYFFHFYCLGGAGAVGNYGTLFWASSWFWGTQCLNIILSHKGFLFVDAWVSVWVKLACSFQSE